jgi:hypothetical protein
LSLLQEPHEEEPAPIEAVEPIDDSFDIIDSHEAEEARQAAIPIQQDSDQEIEIDDD